MEEELAYSRYKICSGRQSKCWLSEAAPSLQIGQDLPHFASPVSKYGHFRFASGKQGEEKKGLILLGPEALWGKDCSPLSRNCKILTAMPIQIIETGKS